jgi:hypothetical protein
MTGISKGTSKSTSEDIIKGPRKLGNGYSLALKTSDNTHLTLVYFNNLKRGYEQNLVKNMCIEYFNDKNVLMLCIDFGERSIKVLGKVIDIVTDLEILFPSFYIDKDQVPRIDLHGNDINNINIVVSTIDNFYL